MPVCFWFLIEGRRRHCTGIRGELGGGGIGPWEWRGWRVGREFQHLFPLPHQGIDCAEVEEGCQDETLKRSVRHGLWNSARELCYLGSGDDQMRQRAGQRGVFHPQLSDPSLAPLCQHWHWAAKASQGCQIVTSKGGCEKPGTTSRAGGTGEVREYRHTTEFMSGNTLKGDLWLRDINWLLPWNWPCSHHQAPESWDIVKWIRLVNSHFGKYWQLCLWDRKRVCFHREEREETRATKTPAWFEGRGGETVSRKSKNPARSRAVVLKLGSLE